MSSRRTRTEASLPARRREDLLEIVHTTGQATVGELAERFDVSLDTIRRDIDHLADRGLLARTHGGAVPGGMPAATENPLSRRMTLNQDVKRTLGRAASELVSDGDTVIVNGGTTTLAFAAALVARRDLTIVTNSLVLPASLPAQAIRDVYVIGGELRLKSMTTIGPVRFPGHADHGGHNIKGDLAVIGVGSLSVEEGLSSGNLPEAQMIREMIDHASKLVVIADGTKAGYVAFAEICSLSRVDVLVSDLDPDHPVVQAVIEQGGQLVPPAGSH